MDRQLLKVEEAAEALGISRSQLYQMLARGDVASLTIGRSRRVPADAVRDFIRLETERQAREARGSSETVAA